MTPSIVPLTPESLDAVAGIETHASDTHWSRAQFEKELSSPIARFFVLQEQRNILGYGGYWKVGDDAQITNLVVPPTQRRQGIGQHLLDYLLDRAKAEGCRTASLEVRSRNQAALALYRKAGFQTQGTRPKVYTHPIDDAVLMEKKL
jgi:ribosomal-protein-alanine N-acetyltransferase